MQPILISVQLNSTRLTGHNRRTQKLILITIQGIMTSANLNINHYSRRLGQELMRLVTAEVTGTCHTIDKHSILKVHATPMINITVEESSQYPL